MKNFWEWFAQLACFAIAVLSIRIILVERERSLDAPMPKLAAAEAPTPLQSNLPASSHTKKTGTQSTQTDVTWGVAYRMGARLDLARGAAQRIGMHGSQYVCVA